MKTKQILLASLVVTGLSSSVLAAPTRPSSSTLTSAMEVLNLPAENRRSLIHELGDKHYDSFIALAFSDAQSMSVRWRALTAAAESRREKATGDLVKAGGDKTWYMRNAALVALQEVNPSEGEVLAKKLLKDKALVVRSAAVTALEKSTNQDTRELLWDELNQGYNFKNTQSLWIRQQIVGVLGKKPLDREIKIFAQLLSDKDAQVQGNAIIGLQKLTGVKLDDGQNVAKSVSLWKDYVRKERIEL
jgi:HEAT repeat protein